LKIRIVILSLCLAGALLFSNELDVLTLGSDTARSLGLPVGRMRVLALAFAAALAERDASRETPAEPIPESPGDL